MLGGCDFSLLTGFDFLKICNPGVFLLHKQKEIEEITFTILLLLLYCINNNNTIWGSHNYYYISVIIIIKLV